MPETAIAIVPAKLESLEMETLRTIATANKLRPLTRGEIIFYVSPDYNALDRRISSAVDRLVERKLVAEVHGATDRFWVTSGGLTTLSREKEETFERMRHTMRPWFSIRTEHAPYERLSERQKAFIDKLVEGQIARIIELPSLIGEADKRQ